MFFIKRDQIVTRGTSCPHYEMCISRVDDSGHLFYLCLRYPFSHKHAGFLNVPGYLLGSFMDFFRMIDHFINDRLRGDRD